MQRFLASNLPSTDGEAADRALPDHIIDCPSALAAAGLLTLAALVFTMAGGLRLLERRYCQLQSQWLRVQPGHEATATSRGGAPCLISVRNTHSNVQALEIVSPPQNGRIDMHGKTSLLYVPNAKFKGEDTFDFKVIQKSAPNNGSSIVSMKINVDR